MTSEIIPTPPSAVRPVGAAPDTSAASAADCGNAPRGPPSSRAPGSTVSTEAGVSSPVPMTVASDARRERARAGGTLLDSGNAGVPIGLRTRQLALALGPDAAQSEAGRPVVDDIDQRQRNDSRGVGERLDRDEACGYASAEERVDHDRVPAVIGLFGDVGPTPRRAAPVSRAHGAAQDARERGIQRPGSRPPGSGSQLPPPTAYRDGEGQMRTRPAADAQAARVWVSGRAGSSPPGG
jgi:hypothetical protein